MGIVFIVCFPRGMYEPPDRWRSTVRKAGLARRQKRSGPRLFLQRRSDGPQLHIPDWQLSDANCLELCRTNRVSYRQNSPGTQTLERALSSNQPEDITRLYLGLTLAREGDRQRGLKEIESGMRGINNFLDYINQAQRFSIGQYWDSGRDIRSAIQANLAMISGKDLDWQRLTANTEWLGLRMEAESDLARRQEARDKPPRSPE